MGEPNAYFRHRVAFALFACNGIAFAILLVLAIGHSVQAQDEDQSLEILNDSVSSTLDKAKTEFDAKVYVRNASDLSADDLNGVLKFSVVARSSDKNIIEPSVTIEPRSSAASGPGAASSGSGVLKPYSVVPVNLKIAAGSEKSFSGYLVVSSKEGNAVEPGTTPLELKKPIARGDDLKGWRWFPPFYGPSWILFIPFVAASAVVIISYFRLGQKRLPLWSPLGSVLEVDAKS